MKVKSPIANQPITFSHIKNSPALRSLFLVWLFSIPALLPLMQPTITHSADGLLHLYRVMALEQAVWQGTFFPRWLPDLAYGYGFPLFVFYAPLAYYLTLLPALLPNLPLTVAFNASFALALLLAGSGTCLFINALLGRGGLLAAIAYVYAPFQLYNILFRGSLPAAWAMAAFPFVFWAFARLLSLPPDRTKSFVLWRTAIAALSLGGALLMHNTLSLLFMPLLAAYLTIYILVSNYHARPIVLRWVAMALALGLGLAAFFLLPAMLEKEFAQVERVIISPDFDFRFNFVLATELVALPRPANTGLLNPTVPLTLGLPQLILSALGLGAACYRLVKYRAGKDTNWPAAVPSLVIFSVLSLAIAIFMMLEVSVTVWEWLPLLEFVQFPHRLLGPAALLTASLSAIAVAMAHPRTGLWLTGAGIVVIYLASIPLLYPRYYPALLPATPLPAQPTTVDMFAYEHTSGTIGTTSFGEYLPVWVQQIPAGSPLEPLYQSGLPVERLAAESLPPEATVHAASYGFNSVSLEIDTPEPFQAIFHNFYFPGWQATIDGQSAPTGPATEQGLLGVSVPAGRHRLEITFQETPLRRAANALSLAALLVVAAILIFPRRARTGAVPSTDAPAAEPISRHAVIPLVGLATALVLLKLLYFDQFDSPLKHTFDGSHVKQADFPQQVNFGNQITLLGYSLPAAAAEPGQQFALTAFWQTQTPLTVDYSSLAQLVDAERHLYAGQDNLHPGAMQTSVWPPWGFVQDSHHIPVPPGTPPGDYFLVTGLYRPDTWARLPVLSETDSSWGDVVAVPVTVTTASRPPTLTELNIGRPADAVFDGVIKLLGSTLERDTLRPNDFFRAAIFWEALNRPTQNYQISLQLVNADGGIQIQQTGEPSHNRYPTTRWQAGERVRDNHALWIASDFPTGEYRLQVRVLDTAKQPTGDWITLGSVIRP